MQIIMAADKQQEDNFRRKINLSRKPLEKFTTTTTSVCGIVNSERQSFLPLLVIILGGMGRANNCPFGGGRNRKEAPMTPTNRVSAAPDLVVG